MLLTNSTNNLPFLDRIDYAGIVTPATEAGMYAAALLCLLNRSTSLPDSIMSLVQQWRVEGLPSIGFPVAEGKLNFIMEDTPSSCCRDV